MRVITRRDINHIDSELSRAAKLVARRDRCGVDTFAFPITIESDHRSDSPLGYPLPPVLVLVSCNARRGLSQRCASFSFPLFLFPPPSADPRKTRDWIKIAAAISRTHDIGENASEALIMADARRAVAR